MNQDNIELILIFCPPIKNYNKPPLDQIDCIPSNCPQCKDRIWLSRAKRLIMDARKKEEIYLCCYDCFGKYVQENSKIKVNYSVIKVNYINEDKKYTVKMEHKKQANKIDKILNKN